MTGKEFLAALERGQTNLLKVVLALLDSTDSRYCVIGGLAVNAYADPVVSLDLNLVVIASDLDGLCAAARDLGMTLETHPHSINLSAPGSDLRIQLQTDPRYQAFLARSALHDVLGYPMHVASVEDVLQGKTWAYQDPTRRKSKRQKDLADILRLAETHPRLLDRLPPEIRNLAES